MRRGDHCYFRRRKSRGPLCHTSNEGFKRWKVSQVYWTHGHGRSRWLQANASPLPGTRRLFEWFEWYARLCLCFDRSHPWKPAEERQIMDERGGMQTYIRIRADKAARENGAASLKISSHTHSYLQSILFMCPFFLGLILPRAAPRPLFLLLIRSFPRHRIFPSLRFRSLPFPLLLVFCLPFPFSARISGKACHRVSIHLYIHID